MEVTGRATAAGGTPDSALVRLRLSRSSSLQSRSSPLQSRPTLEGAAHRRVMYCTSPQRPRSGRGGRWRGRGGMSDSHLAAVRRPRPARVTAPVCFDRQTAARRRTSPAREAATQWVLSWMRSSEDTWMSLDGSGHAPRTWALSGLLGHSADPRSSAIRTQLALNSHSRTLRHWNSDGVHLASLSDRPAVDPTHPSLLTADRSLPFSLSDRQLRLLCGHVRRLEFAAV